jgi:hypothetical protein
MLDIKKVDEHYEAFVDGKFVVSGDTLEEVIRDVYKEENNADGD